MKKPTRSLLAWGLAGATAIGLAACAPTAEEPTDRSISIAVDALPLDLWDPAQGPLALDGNLALHAVLTPLFFWAADGSPIPGVATGYTVNEDATAFEITLRDDVTFPDGSHMDAAGVEKYLDHLLVSPNYLNNATAAQVGAEFTATGEYTLELTTTTPVFHPQSYMYYDVVRLLFFAPILSPSAIDDPELAKAEPQGVGPYMIEDYIPEVEVTLVRNPDYWDPEAYPYDTIVFKLLADPIAKLNALKSGQIDAAPLTAEQVAEAESSGLQVQSGSPTYYTLIIRDPATSTLEPLRDVRVRQALMLAFDREAIAETIDQGYGRVSSQAFIEGQAEYIEGGDERFGYDLERARDLMAEAGYADGFDVVIPTLATDAGVRPIVESALGDIGIRVTFEQLPDIGSYYVALMAGEYPLNLFLNYNINTLRILDEEFVGLGRVFDVNPELQRLLPVIKYGAADESAEASQELGEMILDEGWYVPISRPAAFWGTVQGAQVATNDAVPPMLYDFGPTE